MVTTIVTKFGDSQNPSPNLVKKLHVCNLFLFLKKKSPKWSQYSSPNLVKKSHFINLFSFFKKNHQNGHDNCHQIWWFTKPITKFGEENRTFLITIHPSGPSSPRIEINMGLKICLGRKPTFVDEGKIYILGKPGWQMGWWRRWREVNGLDGSLMVMMVVLMVLMGLCTTSRAPS